MCLTLSAGCLKSVGDGTWVLIQRVGGPLRPGLPPLHGKLDDESNERTEIGETFHDSSRDGTGITVGPPPLLEFPGVFVGVRLPVLVPVLLESVENKVVGAGGSTPVYSSWPGKSESHVPIAVTLGYTSPLSIQTPPQDFPPTIAEAGRNSQSSFGPLSMND